MKTSKRYKLVTFTGGTGGAGLHIGLGKASLDADITAVTGAGDDGGAQTLFVKGIGLLPTSDLLQIVVAVLPQPYRELFKAIFGYRFVAEDFEKMLVEDSQIDPIVAKSAALLWSTLAENRVKLGNLCMMALAAHYGSEARAIDAINSILPTKVIPITVEKAGPLIATYDLGDELYRDVSGESTIDVPKLPFQRKCRIVGLRYTNKVSPNPTVIEDTKSADGYVLGPGDPYTSVLQACILKEVIEAMAQSSATLRILVMNLMTKEGQTFVDGKPFSAYDHFMLYAKYLGMHAINTVIIHRNGPVSPDVLEHYKNTENSVPVEDDMLPETERMIVFEGVTYWVGFCDIYDQETNQSYRIKVVHTDVMSSVTADREKGDMIDRSLVRHDTKGLGVTIRLLVEGLL